MLVILKSSKNYTARTRHYKWWNTSYQNEVIIEYYSDHIETSQLVCSTNQLTGFYTMRQLVFWKSRIKNDSVLNVFKCKNKNSEITPIVIIVDLLVTGVD